MKELVFSNVSELSKYMMRRTNDSHRVVAVLFFDASADLVRKLLAHDSVTIGLMELSDVCYGDYEKEYYVSLSDDHVLSVEKAYNGKYLCAEAELLLIDGDANSKIISSNSDSECIEINFRNESCCNDYESYCMTCDICKGTDPDIELQLFSQTRIAHNPLSQVTGIRLLF